MSEPEVTTEPIPAAGTPVLGMLLPTEAAQRLGVSTTTLTNLANAGTLSVAFTRGAKGHRRYYAREIDLLGEGRWWQRLAEDRAGVIAARDARIERLEAILDRIAATARLR